MSMHSTTLYAQEMIKRSHFLMQSLFFLLFLTVAVVSGDTNVLINPGFEDGTSVWTARNCLITAVPSPVHTGSAGARAYNRNATWQGIQQDMLNKMVIGETYAVSGWVRTTTSVSSDVHITFQKTDGGNSGDPQYQRAASGTANNSGWTYISGNYTLSVTGTLTQLNVYIEGPDSGIDLYIDDVQVYGPQFQAGTANGQVDINKRHQTIEGFGAAGAWYEGWLTSNSQREAIYDLIFGDLGLDIYRLRNTYDHGTEGATYMSQSAQIVSEAKARNPNIKFLITSWSPPTYLKSNGLIAGGDNATLIGGPSNYDYNGFADWWANSITAWRNIGIDPDYISIQNEVDYDASWDSCRFEPTETSTIAGYDIAFETVYNEMTARFGASMPKMLGPETTGLSRLGQYLSAIINPSHMYGYAHHLYNCSNGGSAGCGDEPDLYLTNMANTAAQWSDKPLFQTEYEHSTEIWPDALNLAHLIYNALVVEGVSAYIYWDLYWADGGLIGLPSYGASTYNINSDYYGFKHYSAFIYPGWQRVQTNSDNPGLKLSAYISPNNQQLSAVMINTSAEDIQTSLSFSGFTIGSGSVYRTTSSQNCALVGSYNGTTHLTIPSSSIVTLALTSGTVDTTPPAAPANLSATAAGSLVVLDWDDNTETDLAGYNIYRSTIPGAGYTKLNASLVIDSTYNDTTAVLDTAHYYVVTAVDTSSNESNNSNEANATPVATGIGTILRQWWTGISGTTVSDLTSSANYPDNPIGSDYLASFETPTDWENSYGTRIRGWLHPVISGSYTFWIAGDDNCELWLSINGSPATAALIAEVTGWTYSLIWDKYPEQQSDPIQLTAGQKYYIQALHKEGTGGDNLAVAWSGPGLSQQVIDGMYLSPWPTAPYGDFEPDNDVDINDLAALFALWLEDNCFATAGIDLDGDCLIDLLEFSVLSQNWGL